MTENKPPGLDEIEEGLSRVPLFSHLDSKGLRKLSKLCMPTSFAEGDPVLEEGAMGLGLFLVTAGKIDIFRAGPDGQVPLGTAGAGDILGEIALVDDQPRTASAVAAEPTECLLLTRDSFDTLVKKEPEIAWCIVPGLAERIRELHERLAEDDVELVAELPTPVPEPKKAGADAARKEDDGGETDWSAPMTRMLRFQYGLMVGAAKGFTKSAKVMERFVDGFADETDLKDTDNWNEIVERIPDGMIEASRAALKECEDVPQAIADAFSPYNKKN